jgi:hypothetical protein
VFDSIFSLPSDWTLIKRSLNRKLRLFFNQGSNVLGFKKKVRQIVMRQRRIKYSPPTTQA